MWKQSVLLLVALCALARANPAAEKVFQDGKALLAAGKVAEACEAFRRSQELEARVGTLLNLGDCEEKRGRFATAWAAFVDARALATRLGDARATVADQHAAALVPRLAYVTVTPPSKVPAGLVVRRNERDVPGAELGIEVPIDPGHYEYEVAAPGFVTWKHSLDVATGQRAAFEIPALVVDPNAPPPPALVVSQPGRTVTSHRVGVGAAVGASSDGKLTFGVRLPLHLAPLGTNATLRAVPSMFYRERSFEDPFHKVQIYSVGVAIEYVAPLASKFVLTAGIGIGLDFVNDSYEEDVGRKPSVAARLSPTLRLGRSVDVGLHLQVVASTQQIVGLGTVGVDYFFF